MLSLPQAQQLGCSEAQLFLPCSPLCQQTQPVLPPTGSSTYSPGFLQWPSPTGGRHTTFGCDTPLLSTAASLPNIPFPWSPRSRPKLQMLPHYTNSVHRGAKCKAWITSHFRVQLEQGWESSLGGYAVAELLLAHVEDSTEAWLNLQDR